MALLSAPGPNQKFLPVWPYIFKDKKGFTLIEVLVAVLIIGIVVTSFQGMLHSYLSGSGHVETSSRLLAQGRFAMDRMVDMVTQTDDITTPGSGSSSTSLVFSERILDITNNDTLSYTGSGDGYPDADNDSNGLVNLNDLGYDATEYVTLTLDKTDEDNFKLVEILPDYTTSSMSDLLEPSILCEHVTRFICTRLSTGLVEIELTLEDQGRTITLKTRALADRTSS